MQCVLFALIFASLLMQPGCKTRVTEYDFTTLDIPPGSFGTRALGVNANGDIVGTKSEHPTGFFHQKGKTSNIQIPGSLFSEVSAINDSGIIVGGYGDSVTKMSRAFLYDGKTFTNIEPPAVTHIEPSANAYSYAYGINSRGVVVGFYGDNSGGHGFLYNGLNHVDLNFPGVSDTRATAINNQGRIVGFYFQQKDKRFHGFIYDAGKYTTLDYPKPDVFHTRLQGINDQGDIVGFCSCGTNKAARGFLYKDGLFTDIQFPNAGETFPNAINNNGMIVGFYNGRDGGHGFYAVPRKGG